MTLDIWLLSEAEFVLYDDDERARTEEIVKCQASKKAGQITLNIGASDKTSIAKFNKTSRPKQANLNGRQIQPLASREALEKAEGGWYFDPSSVVYVRFSPAGNASELILHL
jgi:hypothetical protein